MKLPLPPDGAHTQSSVNTLSYVHAQAYRSQVVIYPTPLRLYIPRRQGVTVSSLANIITLKNGEIGATKRHRTNGERGWEGVQTLSSPILWEKPVLLQTASSPPSLFGQRLRKPRNWAAAPPPCSRRHTKATNALPCSLLSVSLGEAKLSWAGSECGAWEQTNQPPVPPHWSSSAPLGDPSQYVTTLYR